MSEGRWPRMPRESPRVQLFRRAYQWNLRADASAEHVTCVASALASEGRFRSCLSATALACHRVVFEQAEWVTRGVEHDTDIFLWLKVGQGRSGGNGPARRLIQVADGDVQVLGCVLCAVSGGPYGSGELRLVLEVERRALLAGWGSYLSPAVLGRHPGPGRIARRDRPPQELRIESGEVSRCWRADRHGRHRHRRATGHLVLQAFIADKALPVSMVSPVKAAAWGATWRSVARGADIQQRQPSAPHHARASSCS